MRRLCLLVLTVVSWRALPVMAQQSVDTVAVRTKTLREVFVSGKSGKIDDLNNTQMGIVTLDSRSIIRTPVLLGQPDVLKTLQMQAGVTSGVEGFAGMYVRGGENDQNFFLLHHLPLFSVYHLGGLFSAFNPTMVEKVDFYKSGFPAQYGGGSSSVSNITMREGDYEAYHGELSVGLTSGNAVVTGPIIHEKLAFTAGLRRSWLDLLAAPALAIANKKAKEEGKKTLAAYSFTEANLKLDYKLRADFSGYTHMYYGNDHLKFGKEHLPITEGETFREKNVMTMDWGNIGVSTGLTYHPLPELLVSTDAYYLHYAADTEKEREDKAAATTNRSLSNSENGIDDLGVSLHFSHQPFDFMSYQLGCSYTHHQYRPELARLQGNSVELSIREVMTITANELNLWAENTMDPVQWLQLNVGGRYTYYISDGRAHTRLEPRAGLRLSLGSALSMKASYARMHQFVQQVSNNYVSLPTDGWQPVGNQWEPLESDQVSAGLYGNIGEGHSFSVEGYYKWMRHLLEYRDGNDVLNSGRDWASQLTSGDGTVYGVDLSYHIDMEPLTGIISYGLMWNSRQFDELNGGKRFPAKFDNRHKLNISACYQLEDNVDINAEWTYMTGNRVTLALNNYLGVSGAGFTDDVAPTGYDEWKGLDNYTSRNNIRLPAYHRLDVSINFHHHFTSGHERIWSFGLYNAYCHMNPIAIQKTGLIVMAGDSTTDECWDNHFQTFSLLPIIPSVSYTFKF